MSDGHMHHNILYKGEIISILQGVREQFYYRLRRYRDRRL
jgi:hypothetical protein